MNKLFCLLLLAALGFGSRAEAFIEDGLIIALSEDETAVLISGPIDELPGGASMAQIIRDLPASVRLLQLESGGGRLDVALDIAREVKKRGFNTYTNVQCNSACTFIYLVGRERSANEFTRFEFHRVQYLVKGRPENGPLQAYWQGRASQFYLDHGLPAAFVAEIESKPSTQKSLAERLDMGFVTKDESIPLQFGNGRTLYP